MSTCSDKTTTQVPPVQLERFFYSTGQMLRSSDLNAVLAVAEARRLWHNRALHNAFGVSDGLSPSAVSDKKLNLVGLTISPGLAYDCTGAQLLLQTETIVPLPVGVPDSVSDCFLLARQ